MKLENEFTVPAGVDTVYRALSDPETISPCFPGATLDSHDGDDVTGTITVALGPISVTYTGRATFVERDATGHRVVVDATGRDSHGSGTASARATLTMTDEGGRTRVTVHTEMQVTGRPAQFGRGFMSDVGDRSLDRFGACLGEELADGAAPAAPEAPAAAGPPSTPAPAPVAAGAPADAVPGPPSAPVASAPVASAPVASAPVASAPVAAVVPATSDPTTAPGAGPVTTAPNAGPATTTAPVERSAPAAPTAPADQPRRRPVEEVGLLGRSREAVLGHLTPIGVGAGVLALALGIIWFARRR